VLRDFLDSFAPLARAPLPPAITFEFDCEVTHGAVLLDSGSLQDSLLNLVLNARDAIGEGPGRSR
jgi:nitrogen-specific signal transduction histidine kinase